MLVEKEAAVLIQCCARGVLAKLATRNQTNKRASDMKAKASIKITDALMKMETIASLLMGFRIWAATYSTYKKKFVDGNNQYIKYCSSYFINNIFFISWRLQTPSPSFRLY